MKHIVLFIVGVFMLALNSYGQTVGYTYKPFAAEGCNVKYSVSKQDTTYYIIVTVTSDRLIFLNKSTLLFKNFEGNVIELKGELMGNGSESAGIVSGNVVIPITEISSTAQFTVTPYQFEQLKNGISKVRLSTTPIEHERTFKKDKIGKKLYQFFIKQRDKDIDF